MESKGVYWKNPFAAPEAVAIIASVVNARNVEAVPGRKTDMADAKWLATLARAGLLRASFIPPLQMRQLRLVARQRQRLVAMCSAERNRLRKVLVDAGIRINVLVADIHGASAPTMVKALTVGKPMHEVLDCKGRLPAGREELFEALTTERFSAVHRFVAEEIMLHIDQIQQRIARLDLHLLDGLLASWVGICPDNNESAGKRKTGRIRKGNAWVRRLGASSPKPRLERAARFKAKFDALAIRKGLKKSVRSSQGPAQRPALDQDAAQTRL